MNPDMVLRLYRFVRCARGNSPCVCYCDARARHSATSAAAGANGSANTNTALAAPLDADRENDESLYGRRYSGPRHSHRAPVASAAS